MKNPKGLQVLLASSPVMSSNAGNSYKSTKRRKVLNMRWTNGHDVFDSGCTSSSDCQSIHCVKYCERNMIGDDEWVLRV